MGKHEMFFDTHSVNGRGFVTTTVKGDVEKRDGDFELPAEKVARIRIDKVTKWLFVIPRKVERINIITSSGVKIDILSSKTGGKFAEYVEKTKEFAQSNNLGLRISLPQYK